MPERSYHSQIIIRNKLLYHEDIMSKQNEKKESKNQR